MKKYVSIICASSSFLIAHENHWVGLDSGYWSEPKNWHPSKQSGPDETFVLSNEPFFAPTILVSSNQSLGTLKFDYNWMGMGYEIDSLNGAGLTFDASTGATLIQVTNQNGNGSHKIDCPITLAKPVTIEQNSSGFLTISGSIFEMGKQSLTKTGPEKLILSGANRHSGGTILESGILSISSDANLGMPAAPLCIEDATLLITDDFPSIRPTVLNGTFSTIDTQENRVSFFGPVSGEGTLIKKGKGTLILSGENSYSGATALDEGTLEGDSHGLQGEITLNEGTSVAFHQSNRGAYAGSLKGKGTLVKDEEGLLEITGDNSQFTGPTCVKEGELKVNGSLGSSPLVVSAGAKISGNGVFGPTTIEKGATLSPGNSIGKTEFNAPLTLVPGSFTEIEFSPFESDFILVNGDATLTGAHVILSNEPGFYGYQRAYKILSATTLNGTTFGELFYSNPNFFPSLFYTLTDVILIITTPHPFLGYTFTIPNAESVALNLDALFAAGELTVDLSNVVNSFSGQPFSEVEKALDKMQPSAYSALALQETETQSKLVSLFRTPVFNRCKCSYDWEPWAKPYFNALKVTNNGEQVGFDSTTGGLALGWNKQITDTIALGLGAAWNKTNLKWNASQGHADANGFYGALYTDYQTDTFYFGGGLLSGVDLCHVNRNISFFTTNRTAHANYNAINVITQLRTAYLLDFSPVDFYPFINVDLIYLQSGQFSEQGAGGLDLTVQSRHNTTLRPEIGVAVQGDMRFGDFCLTPLFSGAWVNMTPLSGTHLDARFVNTSSTFTVQGWDQIWNLIAFDAAIRMAYQNYSFDLEYNAEISATEHPRLINQYGTFTFSWQY